MVELISGKSLNRIWKNVTDKFEPSIEGKILSTNDFTNEDKASLLALEDRVNIASEGLYKIKGSINFSDIPVDGNLVGDVYSINDSFTADERFIPSEQGAEYPPDVNIVYTSEGWDVIGGIYDFNQFLMKDDIKPIDNDHITDTCIIPDPVTNIVIGDGEDKIEFNGIQDNITFDTIYDDPQTISLDIEGIGRGDLEYAITDTPVVSTFSRMSRARSVSSPYDSLDWKKYTTPFTLPYGNSIIYTRIKSVNNEYIYACSNGIHIHEYDEGVITPATITSNEFITYTCKHCDHSYTEEIPDTMIIPTPITLDKTLATELNLITGDVTIPKYFEKDGITYEITKIGASTFSNCDGLTSINIPNNIGAMLYDSLFQNCTNLVSVKLPEGITTIGSRAFSGCASLASVTLPNTLCIIGQYSFEDCTNLQEIIIPNSVYSIQINAFYRCTSLTSINIPDNVTSIRDYTFSVCTSLTSVNIPDSVTSIGSYAFGYCNNLANIVIPNTVTTIENTAFFRVPHIEYYGTATGAPWGANSIN